jgi:type II secretory pathway component PulF
MQFAYEALRPDGSVVTDVLEAAARGDAADALRGKGLIPLRLDDAGPATTRSLSGSPAASHFQSARLTSRDMILFTRQMKMLLESGAPLVPSLQAAETQAARPFVRVLLGRIRERVEQGESLAVALEPESHFFDPVFRGMVAAGEATASLPQVFGRLCELAQQQQRTRKLVTGALLYPAILTGMLTVVVAILLFFVVPRFMILFTTLNSPLPATTKLLFDISQGLKHGWPYLLAAVGVLVAGIVLAYRSAAARAWLDDTVVRLPVIGRLASRLILARVLRVWAAMLRCHVPLLDTIRQSRAAVRNGTFLRLIDRIEADVSGGGRVGQAIADSGVADPVIISALRTGEENGRLAEATDFVSSWLDEDNTATVQHVARLAEPLLLAVMGVFVGFIAMSLFVPMFDMATAAH